MSTKILFGLFLGAAAMLGSLSAAEKQIICKFEQGIPYGVSAWSQSERVRKGEGKESRFGPYVKGSAAALTNDALVDRGGEAAEGSDPRETAFWQAYDEKGWYIYINSKEPLVKDLVNQLANPLSPGRKESYELFFTTGLEDSAYYQIYITPYLNKTTFFDWGSPHSDYRSLKSGAQVESLPLANGVGTFLFIPWHLVYEKAPLNGGEWRFTLIRWMPFSKAGGLTWGGQVHETGKFGRVVFEKPSPEQQEAMERQLLQYAWYKFKATAGVIREYVTWEDPVMGDPEFYEKVVAPEIARLTAIGENWGDPQQWTSAHLKEGRAHLKDFMEFDYKVSTLRDGYLEQKLFSKQ